MFVIMPQKVVSVAAGTQGRATASEDLTQIPILRGQLDTLIR